KTIPPPSTIARSARPPITYNPRRSTFSRPNARNLKIARHIDIGPARVVSEERDTRGAERNHYIRLRCTSAVGADRRQRGVCSSEGNLVCAGRQVRTARK